MHVRKDFSKTGILVMAVSQSEGQCDVYVAASKNLCKVREGA